MNTYAQNTKIIHKIVEGSAATNMNNKMRSILLTKKLLAKRIPAPLRNLQYSVRNIFLCHSLQTPS